MTTALADIRPDIVSTFISLVLQNLRVTVGVDATVASALEPYSERTAIAVSVDFEGDVHGPVTWIFPAAVALELVRRLLDDAHPADETMADGAAELANILSGSATAILEGAGFQCQMGTPRFHVGELPPGIRVRLSSASGPIDVIVSLAGTT